MNTITAGINGDNRTIDIHWEAVKAKADDTMLYAAKQLYRKNPLGDVQLYSEDTLIAFDDLTNQQKLDVVEIGLRNYLLHLAKEGYRYEQNQINSDTIETELETKYEI